MRLRDKRGDLGASEWQFLSLGHGLNTNHSEDVELQAKQHTRSIIAALGGYMKTFTRLSGGISPTSFLNGVCDELLRTSQDHITISGSARLEQHISRFEKLRCQVYALESELLRSLLDLVPRRAPPHRPSSSTLSLFRATSHTSILYRTRILHLLTCLLDLVVLDYHCAPPPPRSQP